MDLERLQKQVREDAESRDPTVAEIVWPVVVALENLFPNDDKAMREAKRYGLLRFFFNVDSAKKLSRGQAQALIGFAEGDDAQYYAAAIIAERDKELGQQTLL